MSRNISKVLCVCARQLKWAVLNHVVEHSSPRLCQILLTLDHGVYDEYMLTGI